MAGAAIEQFAIDKCIMQGSFGTLEEVKEARDAFKCVGVDGTFGLHTSILRQWQEHGRGCERLASTQPF